MSSQRHQCEYWWPLAALLVGFFYGNVVRYVAKSNHMPGDVLALYTAGFVYTVSGVMAVVLWLVSPAQRAVDSLIDKLVTAKARTVCIRQFAGFAAVNAIFVYGVFAVLLTKNARYYVIASLVAAAISIMALVRAFLFPWRDRTAGPV